MFRQLLCSWACKWLGLVDPTLPPPPADPRDIELDLNNHSGAEIIASAYDHPGTKFLIDINHNRRGAHEREQIEIIRRLATALDTDALIRRLVYLDGQIFENGLLDRQIQSAIREQREPRTHTAAEMREQKYQVSEMNVSG